MSGRGGHSLQRTAASARNSDTNFVIVSFWPPRRKTAPVGPNEPTSRGALQLQHAPEPPQRQHAGDRCQQRAERSEECGDFDLVALAHRELGV